jgi:hypothetical protein
LEQVNGVLIISLIKSAGKNVTYDSNLSAMFAPPGVISQPGVWCNRPLELNNPESFTPLLASLPTKYSREQP